MFNQAKLIFTKQKQKAPHVISIDGCSVYFNGQKGVNFIRLDI